MDEEHKLQACIIWMEYNSRDGLPRNSAEAYEKDRSLLGIYSRTSS